MTLLPTISSKVSFSTLPLDGKVGVPLRKGVIFDLTPFLEKS